MSPNAPTVKPPAPVDYAKSLQVGQQGVPVTQPPTASKAPDAPLHMPSSTSAKGGTGLRLNIKQPTETFKVSSDWIVDGKPIKEGNLGHYQTMDGQPLDASKLTRYVAPPKADPAQLTEIDDPAHPGQKIKAWANGRDRTITPTQYKVSAAEGGAMGKVSIGRVRTGLTDMEMAGQNMPEFEQKLKEGTASMTGVDQFIKDVGNSFTADGVKADAARALALARLNKKNPELARYVRWGLKYAEGESMISQRPSDFRTKMAAFLATAPTGDYRTNQALQGMLGDIAQGREAQTKAMRESVGGTSYVPAGRNGGAGGAQVITLSNGKKINALTGEVVP